MKLTHIGCALLVAMAWGFNFPMSKLGLLDVPPILLCAMRFSLVGLPAAFFCKRPEAPIFLIALYGMATFALQFALLFLAMRSGASAGLASLISQGQIFFTIALAVVFLKEKVLARHIVGGIVALLGLAVIGFHVGGDISVVGLLLLLGASLSLATGNICSKKINSKSAVSLIVWGSLFASVPLCLLSYILENKYWTMSLISHMRLGAWVSVAFAVYVSSFYGYSTWTFLLNKYPAALVTPFALFTPIFGFLGSAVLFHERLEIWKAEAIFLIILGLAIALFAHVAIRKIRAMLVIRHS